MTVFADHFDLGPPLRLRIRQALAAIRRPRLHQPIPRLTDHLLRDLGLTRADLDGL